jgi:hypothetical protein
MAVIRVFRLVPGKMLKKIPGLRLLFRLKLKRHLWHSIYIPGNRSQFIMVIYRGGKLKFLFYKTILYYEQGLAVILKCVCILGSVDRQDWFRSLRNYLSISYL